jgi:Ni/Fe-hydrogenase 1 B-type cytochrome subunit
MLEAYRPIGDDERISQIYIYEAPIRLWHWLNALAVVVLAVTGYFIGTPLPSYTGDPGIVYVMGWIRFLHLASGYLFAALWVLRLWWALVGNSFAHLLFVPPIWSRRWVAGLFNQVAWNLFLTRRSARYSGLNPLAHVAMLLMFVVPSAVLLVTGFGMYAEVAGPESWQYHLFAWMRFTENTIDLHTLHRAAMWVMSTFVMIHVYVAVREDIVSRQSMVSTMLSGFRLFKNTRR